MSARAVEWGREPFAVLVEGEGGACLIPPAIVCEDDVIHPSGARLARGQQAFGSAVLGGEEVRFLVACPVPAFLAEIDRRMAHLSAELGVPVRRNGWPPYDGETQR